MNEGFPEFREVISIHIGQAGTQIGSKCWELYCLEHGLHPDGTLITQQCQEIADCSFFTETSQGKYVPRDLFEADQLLSSKEDASDIFARGKYYIGSKMFGKVYDTIRKIADECSHMQGFLISHATGGGTGSGFSSLVLQHLAEEFPKKPKFLFSVYPTPTISSAVVEPYNSVLTTRSISAHGDCGIVLENQAIFDFIRRKLHIERPHLNQLNDTIAQLASSMTSTLRFPGPLNMDLNEYATNLVPFPRIRYAVCAHSPIGTSEKLNVRYATVEQITEECFEPANQLFPCNPNFGKYIGCCMLYRGDVIPKDVNKAIATIRDKHNVNFVDWCPTNFKVGISHQQGMVTPGSGIAQAPRTLTMIANTTAISSAWDTLSQKFDKLFKKKAFLHWYTNEGMEVDEMVEARYDLAILEHDYLEIDYNP